MKESLLSKVALEMKVTHIAVNAPIALTNSDAIEENVQRRPDITPLYGDFESFVSSQTPTQEDFDDAFWVSTRQNGIVQTWAPLYTMFSRGNITEKARILTSPSVQQTQGCTVVDLYAGIGYFAFSYAKTGASAVLGFELNPWSTEACRRGSQANGWTCKVMKDVEDDHRTGSDDAIPKLLIYELSNEHAGPVVDKHREKLSPVRHVNLGLLPTSRAAWRTAVQCLDPVLGGWLHVHENFGIKEIPDKAAETTGKIAELAQECRLVNWKVVLEHVERVKTYAPGVMHCVLDICLQPG